MSLTIRMLMNTTAPWILVHGTEGIGKSWLATRFPGAIFLQTEDGIPAGLTIPSFGLLETYGQFREALAHLATEPHDYKSAVIDSLDRLEPLIWDDACTQNGWASIETPGFGKGYVVVDKWWLEVMTALDFLRRQRGMMVLMLAHSAVERIDDPRTASYTSYQLRLHKRARGIVQDAVDAIGFLAPDLVIHSEDIGFSKKRSRADGGSTRWLHWEGRPAFVAKNRYNLPAKMMVPLDFDFQKTLAPFFPSTAAVNSRQEGGKKKAQPKSTETLETDI